MYTVTNTFLYITSKKASTLMISYQKTTLLISCNFPTTHRSLMRITWPSTIRIRANRIPSASPAHSTYPETYSPGAWRPTPGRISWCRLHSPGSIQPCPRIIYRNGWDSETTTAHGWRLPRFLSTNRSSADRHNLHVRPTPICTWAARAARQSLFAQDGESLKQTMDRIWLPSWCFPLIELLPGFRIKSR